MIKISELPVIIFNFIISATRIIGLSFMVVLLTLILSITYAKILNKTCDFSFKITIGNGISEIHTRPDNSK